jgi:SAM-dependent methyltransferase
MRSFLPAGLNRRISREQVGGQWDEIGRLQFEFLIAEGLSPEHHLLDMGCGSLRGGVHFVRYLDAGHYVGVDNRERALGAGRSELEHAGLAEKSATLLARNDFSVAHLKRSFQFALAVSLFTHLPFNRIVRCVAEVDRVLAPGGRFYATLFANPGPRLRTEPIEIATAEGKHVHLDKNPYYYSPELFTWLCEGSDLSCEYRGGWGHPRSQHMLVFTKRGS